MLVTPYHLPRLLAAGLVVIFLILLIIRSPLLFSSPEGSLFDTPIYQGDDYADKYNDPPQNLYTKATVVASLMDEDTSWLYDFFPEWQHNVYVVNDPHADLTVPRNKGRESQAYLTFLIDNYHDLPEYMVFLHALRYQWHNEDPMYDGVYPLRNLQLPYVQKHGYANMRCTWLLGCPTELHPATAGQRVDGDKDRVETEKVYAQAFKEIFPEITQPPREVGVPCGAQFAVTRWKVLERPRSDYIHIRDWLTKTHLPDNVSGRVLEYSWHIVFGMPYITCPAAEDCFCQKFGKCNLTCPLESFCKGTYQLPRYSNLPEGWPEVGAGDSGFPKMDWWKFEE